MAFLILIAMATLASADILNSNSVDTNLFNVTTFATGLQYPTDITPLSAGGVLLSTSPNYGSSPGQMIYYSPSGVAGSTVFNSPMNGLLTGSVTLGSDQVVGTYGGLTGSGNTLSIVQPGATPNSPLTTVASLQMTYPSSSWYHSTIGMASEPTPGVPGSYNLVLNVGSEFDNVATPATDTVALTGTGFGSPVSASLHGDSLYMLTINTTSAQPSVTSIQQIATGIRNVYGMAFDAAGDLYFTDNGMDALPPGSYLAGVTPPATAEPNGAPPQADELNMISAAQLGSSVPNFGFPNCYIQYAYGGVPGVPVGSGCTQPLVAFQPLTDSTGVNEIIAPTDMVFAPANFPAPYNDGIFIGFTGGGRPDEESGVVFYSFATDTYSDFIESSNAPITNIIGLASTNNALFLSDFGNGDVYEIQSAVPEPGSAAMVACALLVCGWFRWTRQNPPFKSQIR
jgi:hypothetical protein